MRNPIYAMDTYFYSSMGAYDFDARCEMLKELGYDATYLSAWSEAAWEDVPKLAGVRKRHGLDVAAVYITYDLSLLADDEQNARILRLVEAVQGTEAVELAMRFSAPGSAGASDPSGDVAAINALERLLRAAERNPGIKINLYPHLNFWLERFEDAVRVAGKLNHSQLGVVFCGFHWYVVDGEKVQQRLIAGQRFLRAVNLCGSRRYPGKPEGLPASIEPLDAGEMDNFAVLGLLKQMNFAGPIGFQGYSVGGDVYSNLKRSLVAFRDMERRLERHPDWAQLRFT